MKCVLTFEHYRNFIEQFSPYMDDYLFIFDMKNESWFISPKALDRFKLSVNETHSTADNDVVIDSVVYENDLKMLRDDMDAMFREQREEHDLIYRWIDKRNRPVWVNCRMHARYDSEGNPTICIGCLNEVGRMPIGDNATGLLKIIGEGDYIQSIAEDFRTPGFFLMIGVDDMAIIREKDGGAASENLLRTLASLLESILDENEMLIAVTESVLGVIRRDEKTMDAAWALARAKEIYSRICNLTREQQKKDGFYSFHTLSAGYYRTLDITRENYGELMKQWEFVIDRALAQKNAFIEFDGACYERFLADERLLVSMRQAVANGCEGFEMYYQPLVSSPEGKLIGAESLLRFRLDGKIISPGLFIPLLEQSGLIVPVGQWIIRQVVADTKKIREIIPDFDCHINFSFVQVLRSDVLSELLNALDEAKLPRDAIIVELTESGLLEQNNVSETFCENLKKAGIALALDDFGTGYSNFRYLASMEPETIKIDRSFTVLAVGNENEYQVLKAMAQLVHSIGLKLCVEGVETQAELDKIRGIEPDIIQGYFYSKPVPLDSFMGYAAEFDRN